MSAGRAYYNEIDPFCAQWLENLVAADLVAPGEVDRRSIRDVRPGDLVGFDQHHFFAGIGLWSHVLRSVGWPDDKPVWTGSPPCQPWARGGKLLGAADPRHLWPDFHALIRAHEPEHVFGEQIAAKGGRRWLVDVQDDFDRSGYDLGVSDLCAADFGAPHPRRRLYWVAERIAARRPHHGLAHADGGRQPREALPTGATQGRDRPQAAVERRAGQRHPGTRPTSREWADVDWIRCKDGKWRPVESGTQPLVPGGPEAMEQVRAYGNGLCVPVAQAFVQAYLDCRPSLRDPLRRDRFMIRPDDEMFWEAA